MMVGGYRGIRIIEAPGLMPGSWMFRDQAGKVVGVGCRDCNRSSPGDAEMPENARILEAASDVCRELERLTQTGR